MKKIILAGALALVAASSWAFYPEATTPQSMMVVGSYNNAAWRHSYVTVITPEGTETSTEVDLSKAAEGKLLDQPRRMHNIVKGAVIIAVNKYQQEGWEIRSFETEHFGDVFNNLIYVLEKK